MYLDRGYIYSQKFILEKLLEPYYDLDDIVKTKPNAKSRIIEWVQKNGKVIEFETIDVQSGNLNRKEFKVQVIINGKPAALGHGNTKKKAEQDAALKSWDALNLDQPEN